MWLRNWDNAFVGVFGLGANTNATFGDGYVSLKFTNGSSYYIHENSASQNPIVIGLPRSSSYYSTGINTTSSLGTKYEINVGTGTTPVTYNDYKMESPLTSSSITHIGYSFESLGYDSTTKTWGKNVIRSFRNATNGQLTISEIGIYMGLSGSNGGTALVYHEVLDEPIVVEPDQKFNICIPVYAQMLHHPNL